MVSSPAIRILMVAGERSGDLHGAELAHALRDELGEVEIFGCGGEAMRQAGVETIADLRDFAMVGITEVVSGLPRARSAFHAILAQAEHRKPPIGVLIDAPSLNLRLAKKLKRRGVRVVYYVSPQIWAWKKWRLRHLQSRVDKMLCLFDFEEQIYRQAAVPVEYVGHPLIDRVATEGPGLPREEFFSSLGLDPARPMMALLPGSRQVELKYILPGMVEGARELRRRRPDRAVQFLLPIAATLGRTEVESRLRASGAAPELIRAAPGVTYDALRHADAAVVASGTATVETALLGCPMLVVYRVAPSTALFARFMLDVPFYSMVNLLAGKAVVSELIQNDFTPERLASAMERLLDDSGAREHMLKEYEIVRQRLGPSGASRRAAHAVVKMLDCHLSPALEAGR
jgi:lipid-A-disaccharide synthase